MKRAFMFVKVRPGVFGIAVLALLLLVAGLLTPQKTTASVSPNRESATTPSNYDCQFEADRHGLVETSNIHLKTSNDNHCGMEIRLRSI